MIPRSRVLSKGLHGTPKKSSAEGVNVVPKSRMLSKGLQEAGPEGGAPRAVRFTDEWEGAGEVVLLSPLVLMSGKGN